MAAAAGFEGMSGHILEDLTGGVVDCGRLAGALRRSVSRMEVVPGSERRWPQSHSAKVRVTLGDSTSDSEQEVVLFLKKIVARALPDKPLHALRRDLASNRVEARFYREFAPRLADRGVRLLQAVLVDERLDTLDDHDDAHEEEHAKGRLRTGGVLLLLECAEESYIQESPLEADQLRCTLRALAKLHAAAWEDGEFLEAAARRLNAAAGYWTLQQRGEAELERMEPNWSSYIHAFAADAPELLSRPPIVGLGRRLRRLAPWIAQQMGRRPGDPCATLVHGDFKAMNVFLPRTGLEGGEALPIDFQWIGVGLGMSDVAMHLSHSGTVAALEGGGEETLVRFYHAALAERLGPTAAAAYGFDLAWRHYQLGVLDWARMVFTTFFNGASKEKFASMADNPNVGLVYRNVEASFAFVRRVDACLSLFERERDAAAPAGAAADGGDVTGRSRSRSPLRA